MTDNIARHGIVSLDVITGVEGGILRFASEPDDEVLPERHTGRKLGDTLNLKDAFRWGVEPFDKLFSFDDFHRSITEDDDGTRGLETAAVPVCAYCDCSATECECLFDYAVIT